MAIRALFSRLLQKQHSLLMTKLQDTFHSELDLMSGTYSVLIDLRAHSRRKTAFLCYLFSMAGGRFRCCVRTWWPRSVAHTREFFHLPYLLCKSGPAIGRIEQHSGGGRFGKGYAEVLKRKITGFIMSKSDKLCLNTDTLHYQTPNNA